MEMVLNFAKSVWADACKWETWLALFDNPLSKYAGILTAVGYLIYLNDFIAEHFEFSVITASRKSVLGLEPLLKLQLIYFGLLTIALAFLIYFFARPRSIKFGPSRENWTDYGLKNFTFIDFEELHLDIRTSGSVTKYGNYTENDWDTFRDDASWFLGTIHTPLTSKHDDKKVSYRQTKERHEDLLRSILADRYQAYSSQRLLPLMVAVSLSLIGYGMFLLPNLDLFLTILLQVIW